MQLGGGLWSSEAESNQAHYLSAPHCHLAGFYRDYSKPGVVKVEGFSGPKMNYFLRLK